MKITLASGVFNTFYVSIFYRFIFMVHIPLRVSVQYDMNFAIGKVRLYVF